jgi:hypothetical protein
MSQFYTDPSRESEPTALPDAEVFYVETGEWGWLKNGDRIQTGDPDWDEVTDTNEAGYYWWSCFPGCLPDGQPNGPFETEEEAIADAREQAGF